MKRLFPTLLVVLSVLLTYALKQSTNQSTPDLILPYFSPSLEWVAILWSLSTLLLHPGRGILFYWIVLCLTLFPLLFILFQSISLSSFLLSITLMLTTIQIAPIQRVTTQTLLMILFIGCLIYFTFVVSFSIKVYT
jgi:hypothetical protein